MKTEIIRFEGGPADEQVAEWADAPDRIHIPQLRNRGSIVERLSGDKPPFMDPSAVAIQEVIYERYGIGSDGAVVYRPAAGQ